MRNSKAELYRVLKNATLFAATKVTGIVARPTIDCKAGAQRNDNQWRITSESVTT